MKKVYGFLIFILVVGVFYLFDFVHSKLYTIDLVEVTPSPIPADGVTPVTMKARLTRGNKPVAGHDLYIFSYEGGNFAAYRVQTNEAGESVFTYYPYRVSSINPLRDIRIQISDESNSIFLEVNAAAQFVVPAVMETESAEFFNIESFWN
ncbi:MAG: hypothetical protein LBQ88_10635 [Treponema sp.]|jgi:hypothetical protein|nr:hypothetical protein [Treponema sp.]